MEQTKSLLAIDSPSGYTEEAADYVVKTFEELGYKPQKTTKGGVLVCLGGKKTGQGVLLEAHIDTLGGMATMPALVISTAFLTASISQGCLIVRILAILWEALAILIQGYVLPNSSANV